MCLAWSGQVLRELRNLPTCCLDPGYSQPISTLLQQTPESDWDEVLKVNFAAAKNARLANFGMECQHRQVSMATASKSLGRAKSLGMLAAEHVLASIKRLHPSRSASTKQHRKPDRRTVIKQLIATKSAPPKYGRVSGSGWTSFKSKCHADWQDEKGETVSIMDPEFLAHASQRWKED